MSEMTVAKKATFQKRHFAIFASFIFLFMLPTTIATVYLFSKARDQFVSTVAFTVRSEDVSSSLDLLGGLNALGSGSSSDSDVLYEYVQSKALVDKIDKNLNLRRLYSKHYISDPVFSFDPTGTIEDLHEYWPRMVKVYYDKGTGLTEIQVRAFDKSDAQLIAENIYLFASELVNRLSAIAREDAISFARAELQKSEDRLKKARKTMMQFRSENKLVDPLFEIEMQASVINSLQSQLSELLVELDLFSQADTSDDPRLNEIEKRINAVRVRIRDERSKFTEGGEGSSGYSKLIGEFEGLVVDREYAEKSYLASLAYYDSALADAQRQSKYLATYIEPTIAGKSEHPKRLMVSMLISAGLLVVWLILVLAFYAVRDRR